MLPATGGAFWGRVAGAVALAVAVLVLTSTVRVFLSGRQHLNEAVQLQEGGDADKAITRFEDAVRSYMPGSPYCAKALRELDIMAKGAEMRGDTAKALAILEVMRRAILSTRHVQQPFGVELEAAEKAIVRLATQQKQVPRGGAREMIVRPADPSPLTSLLLFIGLIGWVGGGIVLFLQPKGANGELLISPFGALIISIAGFGMWTTMAWIAG